MRMWQIGRVTRSDIDIDTLVGEWLTLKEAAAPLGVSPNRIKTLIRENRMMGVVRGGQLSVPAAFIDGDDLVKGLPGTLVLLTDAGFSTEEALRWLFTPDDTLPGTPIQAMRENRGTEVRRRAQSMAF
ncbi:Rv2175c family DNA-binding protein [Nocardiopsis tropica]